MKQDEQGKQKHQNVTKAPIPHSLFSYNYTVKKVHEFPVSSRDVTNQTPPGQE